ncbi:MAG: tetratricopeptide repeat protein, partial [Phycisphaerales bacterium]|nr:tetratricopeptide repeat protein [Phycisphaerales bacterium]
MSRVLPLLVQSGRLRRAGDLAGAERLLVQATRLDPRHAGAFHDLGQVLIESGRPSDALPVLARALALRPENAGA